MTPAVRHPGPGDPAGSNPLPIVPAMRAYVSLKRMGATVEDVVATLRSAGVRGDPFLPGDCPVARYLRPLTSCDIHVYKDRTYLWVGQRFYIMPTPKPVGDFILAFDGGDYPDLEV